jgi:ABC-type enterochelin transport system permease subunit
MDKHVKPRDNDKAVPVQEAEYKINLVTTVHKPAFTNHLVYLTVITQLSFNFVTSVIFIEFLKTIYPAIDSILPLAGNTIRSYIIEMYNEYKAIKAAELQAVQGMIHFSFDLWTSPNHLALMGIVAHYIDKYGQNQSVSYSINNTSVCLASKYSTEH